MGQKTAGGYQEESGKEGISLKTQHFDEETDVIFRKCGIKRRELP
jgi:hypothetical protein